MTTERDADAARDQVGRLWFHLDEVRPLIAHATGCLRPRLTGAQAAAKAPTVPALVLRGGDRLLSNGWPSWHDPDGDEVTAACHTWAHRPASREGDPAVADRHAFLPLTTRRRRVGDTAVWGDRTPRWAVQAADPLTHWMALTVPGSNTARPRITVHESRGDLYPPDCVWQPATLACVPTVGPGRYPALIAAEHGNIYGGELARFTKATIDAMIFDLKILDETDRSMPGEHAALGWRNDALHVYEVIDAGSRDVHRRVDVIRPDHDGLYPLGAHTWPWLTIPADPSDLPCDTGPDAARGVA